MEIKNGIIKDGIIYEAYESGLDPCYGCIFMYEQEICEKNKPCNLFGIDYKFEKVGKVSQVLTSDNDYAYLYVAHKSDILKFPAEINSPKYTRDYYEGDFIFKEGHGFVKYRIESENINLLYERRGSRYTTRTQLDVCIDKFRIDKHIDITKNVNGQDLVLLLEFSEMRCIYSHDIPSRIWMERIDEILYMRIEVLIPAFMPFLKSGKVETIREVL